MITLRQLRYLAALAEHRHFGRAAAACAVTQPALSMQIRELEREIGVDLIERRPNDIALTETGHEVARRAAAILTEAHDLVDFARHRAVLSGELQLGIIPTLAPYLLPQVLPALQRDYPQLRLHVRETQTATLLAELMKGALDAVLLALPVEQNDVETLELFDDPFLLAVPAQDALARRAQVSGGDIDPRRLVLLEEGHCLRDQALSFCATPERATALGAASLATIMQMVANGYGITLLPRIAATVEARDQRIKLLPFASPKPSRSVGLVWRRTSPRAADFRALGEVVRQAVSGLHMRSHLRA